MPTKPTAQEDEYFARKEFEKKQKIKAEQSRNLNAEQRRELQQAHFMRCPKCGMELVEIAFKDVMIDQCTGCEGVWLDPGELEKVSDLEKTGLEKLFNVFKKS
ncbi:TFIIB-type zinc ribbon-containing protein [Desulfopila inferna]|uniref:TFIIB-type zinc ribbon-containing protein n=1 Tax=Desulfopila inferna TaxID=468528 RepID=UPI001963037C|nr:zf-TFIIB domain-containing protein [Desulfopila inferna]MBM9606331.1 zf-TFIIB domain-containing protein [Desulfopila inferna]